MTTATAETTTQDASAIESAARCQLSADARDLLTAEASATDFLNRLMKANLLDDAVHFMAAALPVRKAVWWGALCAWEAYRENLAPAADEAFHCVVNWIQEPSDANRRAAAALVKPAGAATPVGILLLALHHSGGSIAPPDLPKFEPDARLFTKLLAEAVLLAGKQIGVEKREDRRREFIATAARIASEEITWQRDPIVISH